jgi:deoxycytidine triphosphate deaminase
MIVGQKLLDLQLVTEATRDNLKHGTLDLTIGSIVPIGKEVEAKKKQIPEEGCCFLEPREMVWVLSKEEFNMPPNVTGLATLKTAFTKDGILALNVGIIDPMFTGPISTALINFSDRPRQIRIGSKFFRLIFFEHDDVAAFHVEDESISYHDYVRELKEKSYADFAPSFLNIPSFDDKYYTDKFWSIIWNGIWNNKSISFPLIAFVVILLWFQFEQGFWTFLSNKFSALGDLRKTFGL